MKQISSLVAICVLLILFVLLVAYVHPAPLGASYVAGRFLGSFVILALITTAIARIRKRRFRYDVVLWLTVIAVIFSSYKETIDEYDIRKFEEELKASGSSDLRKVIADSKTQLGARLRTVVAVAAGTASKIAARFDALADPVFLDLYLPPKITDRAVQQKARDRARSIIPMLKDVMPWIDELMKEETDKIWATMQSAPSGASDRVLRGAGIRQQIQRELYRREVDLTLRTYEAVADLSNFLLIDAGSYTWSAAGHVLFPTTALADRFNLLQGRILATVSESQKLRTDAATAQARIDEAMGR